MNASGPYTLKAGEVVARRFVILRHLREEPFGSVYLAQDRHLGLDVALKFAPRRLPQFEAAREALRREGALALKLRHPYILGVFHYEEGEDGCFVVQEPFLGESLLAHLSRLERYRLPLALNLLEQVAQALAFAHDQHEVHQALDPLHILLSGETIKVANFACPPETDGEVRHLELKAYVAPEVVEGDPVSPQANVFSLGVLGFRLAAGSLPYPLTFDEPFPYRLEIPPVDLEEIPLPLQNLLLQCLAPTPQDRFEDAGAFLEMLTDRREMWRTPAREKWFAWTPPGREGPRLGLGTASKLFGRVWEGARGTARKAGQGVQSLKDRLPPESGRKWLLGIGAAVLGVILLVWAGRALFTTSEAPPPTPAAVTPEVKPPPAAGPPLGAPGETPGAPSAPAHPAVTAAPPAVKPPPAAAPATPKEDRYQLTVFTYKDKKQAEALKNRLRGKNIPAEVYLREVKKQKYYVVKVRPIVGEKQAQDLARRLKKELKLPQVPKPEKIAAAPGNAAPRKPRP